MPHHGEAQAARSARASATWPGYQMDSTRKGHRADDGFGDGSQDCIAGDGIKVVTVMAQETEQRSKTSSEQNFLEV